MVNFSCEKYLRSLNLDQLQQIRITVTFDNPVLMQNAVFVTTDVQITSSFGKLLYLQYYVL